MAKARASRGVQDILGQTIGMARRGGKACARLPLALSGRAI
jgi:hypothetical protein